MSFSKKNVMFGFPSAKKPNTNIISFFFKQKLKNQKEVFWSVRPVVSKKQNIMISGAWQPFDTLATISSPISIVFKCC